MLVIRQSQIDSMMQNKKQTVAAALAQTIKSEHEAIFQFYNADNMCIWVIRQLEWLKTWKIEEKQNTTKILNILALFGELFERCPDPSWALDILTDTSQSETVRCIKLESALKRYLANS